MVTGDFTRPPRAPANRRGSSPGVRGKDPNEFNNLAGTKEAANLERELKAALQEWRLLQRDFIPLPVPSKRGGNRGEN